MRGALPVLMLATAAIGIVSSHHAQESKPSILTPEEQKLAAEATTLYREGVQLYQHGKPADAVAKMRQVLEIDQKLYTLTKYPDGHPALAGSLNNLGLMLKSMGQAEQALGYYEQSLAIYRKLYPVSKYPDGHGYIATSLNNLGGVFQAMGQLEKALTHYEQGLTMCRALYPKSNYPDGHIHLASSLNNLGHVFLVMGQAEQALTHFEQGVAMMRTLYPVSKFADGHPDLAASLHNLGGALKGMGQAEKAVIYYEQSLAMMRTLYSVSKYPDGHPHLALSLNNLGSVHAVMGQTEKASTYYEQTLAMYRKLYPPSKYEDGHPHLATTLNNMGSTLSEMGQAKKALIFLNQSLAMRRKLYPPLKYLDGHPDLIQSLVHLGGAFLAMGQTEKAMTPLKQALEMQQKLLQRELVTASETAALDLIAAVRFGTLPVYYSVAVQIPPTAADSYHAAWDAKGLVQRLLSRRHVAASVQRQQSPEIRLHYERLGQVQREIGRLLNSPDNDLAARDQRLQGLSNERESLERALAKQVPALERDRELARLAPADLLSILPAHTAMIDLVRYSHWEMGAVTGERYLAFVLAKGRVIQRVELGEASPIDRAIHEWRTAIESRRASPAAERLGEIVWTKLSPHLPAGTKTLYLSLDGDLARLPWAALPIGKERVLLDEYTLATVPHGRFLLEQLKYSPSYAAAESAFALGNVDYSPSPWTPLPGTGPELKSLQDRAEGRTFVRLAEKAATAQRVREALPQARYAHFATHGFFDAATLTAEQKREAEALKNRQFGDESRRVAAKNPLGYVGLVLAKGEVLSGLSLVDLPLENLKLVTLSACETGLGEYTGGEGVQGLQRAFHLAGCPNVVASLWNVNDAATAALMAKFYHELWTNKKPPIDALREAQLTIYRRPDLIPDLAGERGAPKLTQAVTVKSIDPGPVKVQAAKTADTKLWAAFVISGIGK